MAVIKEVELASPVLLAKSPSTLSLFTRQSFAGTHSFNPFPSKRFPIDE